MSQVTISETGYHFDNFYLDAGNRQLWRDRKLVPLNSKYFDVLLLLVSRSGQLVEKQRIFDEVWSGVFVTDAALTQCIKDVRKQLGDDASNPRYIKTVPKHGYIFIGNTVESVAEKMAEPQPAAATGEEMAVELAAPRPTHARPYKFLDYYTEQDAELFFGREAEVDAICSQILARRSFILHGRSGVGKSSILRAGVMPRLKSEGHSVFVIRSFTDPLHQMVSALASALEPDAGADRRAELRPLVEQFAASRPGRLAIFFLDQFEEFFSLLADEHRRQFVEAVERLVEEGSLPVRLVFALREDMLAEMSQLKTALPEIFHHEYRLKRLTREQAALAIRGPAARVGCQFEPELVARLLDDLGDRGTIDPPQLQIVCDNLYDSREAASMLTVAAYEALGTASQILAGYLERVLRRFNAADLRVAREILTALISVEGQRLVLRASDVCARVGKARGEAAAIEGLIQELVAARVVRRRSQDGEAWLELAHDFLTPEVSRWLTDDDVALKRARGVIERAMENYNAHQLMIDADALDLLLPFGEQLRLTGAEADLLMMSILNRARQAPPWLAVESPSAQVLIEEASRSADSEIRLRAIEAALSAPSEAMKQMLRGLALWDADLMVRKSASIALAVWLGTAAEEVLSAGAAGKKVGLVRRAISLAMIRDYDKRLVRLSRLPILVSLLVVGGLMWVRLRRGGAEIVRRAIGGTVGGAASGLVGGLMLGLGLATARHEGFIQAMPLIIVLVALGTFIGAVGGFSVSVGMIAAAHVAYRHSRWWSVVGGAAGGALVGESSNILGVDTLRALFGQSPTGLTGAFEGAIIGVGVSLGAVLVSTLVPRSRAWQRVLGASLGAMCASVLLTVIGGNLFSASLEIVARLFANSQIRMEPLAPFFGEVHFGRTTQVVLGAIEGLLFGAGLTAGVETSARDEASHT